jgi:hypothetical protein
MTALPQRRVFKHGDRVVYEWEQSLDDVIVYVRPPPGVRAADIDCSITSTRVSLGLKGNPPFLNVRGHHGEAAAAHTRPATHAHYLSAMYAVSP